MTSEHQPKNCAPACACSNSADNKSGQVLCAGQLLVAHHVFSKKEPQELQLVAAALFFSLWPVEVLPRQVNVALSPFTCFLRWKPQFLRCCRSKAPKWRSWWFGSRCRFRRPGHGLKNILSQSVSPGCSRRQSRSLLSACFTWNLDLAVLRLVKTERRGYGLLF